MSSVESFTSAVRDAKTGVEDAVSDVREKSQEAAERAQDAWSALTEALQESIRTRPYTTLAVAGLAGFLYGAMRRR